MLESHMLLRTKNLKKLQTKNNKPQKLSLTSSIVGRPTHGAGFGRSSAGPRPSWAAACHPAASEQRKEQRGVQQGAVGVFFGGFLMVFMCFLMVSCGFLAVCYWFFIAYLHVFSCSFLAVEGSFGQIWVL